MAGVSFEQTRRSTGNKAHDAPCMFSDATADAQHMREFEHQAA
jgi:hypothetical protein